VGLLVVAAFFMALPWLGCVASGPIFETPNGLACTFGIGMRDLLLPKVPGVSGPYWGNLLLGIGYLGAALYVALTKRQL
jgi:hypothetical protein